MLIAIAILIGLNQLWPDIAELVSAMKPRDAVATGTARIIDGDTLELSGTRIRLWGIDAPEEQQTCQGRDGAAYECGRDAAAALREITQARQIECTKRGRDENNHIVAICRTEAGEINEAMVRLGWAVDYTYFSAGAYQAAQNAAKAAGSGIWAGRFVMPLDWRREHQR